MNASLGVIPEMLYYNIVGRLQAATVEAHAGMKWFRSNIRLGSQLALVALAVQFLLAFGHFHGGAARMASTSPDARQSGLQDSIGFAAKRLDGSEPVSQLSAIGLERLKLPTGDAPAGPPADDCAICAVMALASTIVGAAPPLLPAPVAIAFAYRAADDGFTGRNSARVAFQPRAPPIC